MPPKAKPKTPPAKDGAKASSGLSSEPSWPTNKQSVGVSAVSRSNYCRLTRDGPVVGYSCKGQGSSR